MVHNKYVFCLTIIGDLKLVLYLGQGYDVGDYAFVIPDGTESRQIANCLHDNLTSVTVYVNFVVGCADVLQHQHVREHVNSGLVIKKYSVVVKYSACVVCHGVLAEAVPVHRTGSVGWFVYWNDLIAFVDKGIQSAIVVAAKVFHVDSNVQTG